MNGTLKFNSSLIGGRYASSFSLPDFPRDGNGRFLRRKALDILLKEEYGFTDDCGVTLCVTDETDAESDWIFGYSFCGKALHKALKFSFSKGEIHSSFTVDVFIPVKVNNPFFVVQLDFVKRLPAKYCPVEELLDRGIAVAHVDYREVTSDDADFGNGLARLLTDRKKPHCAGKIAIWAYAAEKAGRYFVDNGYTDREKLYVAGHSRLGKAALLACAESEVFAGCFVNCSGCCGAAISRDKRGETVEKINEVFGYWFTEGFSRYNGKEDEMPFDQHFLMAAAAPGKIFIVAASEDEWADTDAQYLCAEAASVVYEENGVVGLDGTRGNIGYGEKNTKGNITFFKRIGPHYFSREDWNFYIDCLNEKV